MGLRNTITDVTPRRTEIFQLARLGYKKGVCDPAWWSVAYPAKMHLLRKRAFFPTLTRTKNTTKFMISRPRCLFRGVFVARRAFCRLRTQKTTKEGAQSARRRRWCTSTGSARDRQGDLVAAPTKAALDHQSPAATTPASPWSLHACLTSKTDTRSEKRQQ